MTREVTIYNYVYFLGIGGIGMSALARFFNYLGSSVYGYDRDQSELCQELESEGMNIHYRDSIDNIPKTIRKLVGKLQADINSKEKLLIVYTPAISSDNKEFQFFQSNNCDIKKRSAVLGEISNKLFTIAVAGTHGKTTTATILAHILKRLGNQVIAFLGGISNNYNTNLLLPEDITSETLLIVEADEYDKSFLHLHPDIAVITSIDLDHTDTYVSKDELELGFNQFASQIKDRGALFIADDIQDSKISVPNFVFKWYYSVNNFSDYYADNIKAEGSRMIFDYINIKNKKINQFELMLAGKHNVSNALAALAVCDELMKDKNFNLEELREAVYSFYGVRRRFDIRINTQELVFVDDYAHHPKEVEFTIEAAKEFFPQRNLTVVFQPHLFSRTRDFANEFAWSLSQADQLILLDIYPAREAPIIGVDSNMLLNLCKNRKKEVCNKNDLLSRLCKSELDVLLTLGAGDIGKLVKPIQTMLN